MSTEVAKVVARLEADIRDFEQGMKKATKRLDGLEKGTGKANKSVGGLNSSLGGLAKTAAAGFGLQQGIKFLGSAIGAFSDLEESVNAVQVQFGEGAETILEFGENAATAVGLANAEFNQLSVVTGALLSGFITDTQQAADETIRLTERASDMASVFNVPVQDALQAVQASLRGEQEPIRRFGVLMDNASVQAKALELGLAGSTKELTAQDKSMARLAIIYEQTDKVAGDFLNTQDSVANKQKVLNAQFTDAQAKLGEALVPLWLELLQAASDLIPVMEALVPAVAEVVQKITDMTGPVLTLVDGLNALAGVGGGLGGLAGNLFDVAVPGAAFFSLFSDSQDDVANSAAGLVDYGKVAGAVSGAQAMLNDEVADVPKIVKKANDAYLAAFRASQPVISAAGDLSGAQALLNDEVANAPGPFDRYASTLEAILNPTKELSEESLAAAESFRLWEDEVTEAGRTAEANLRASMGQIVSLFEKVPRQIRISAEKAAKNIRDQAELGARFAAAIGTLAAAGFDQLVAELEERGPEATRLAEDFARKPALALATELDLQKVLGGFTVPPAVAERFAQIFGAIGADAAGRFLANFLSRLGGGAPPASRPGGNRFAPTALASGGIVTQPTLATIGEKGPEAVIPLNRAGQLGGDTFNTIEMTITVQDDSTAAQRILEETQDALDALAAGRA